ncbi:MAG: hypothetical protein A2X28_03540 [Elusimicrobia bacterium GWA2_56_46]|nr:MAG: hypothetical protein A2X28_03540 [Elusimicrobia bacterium GWA2_56_46]OGR54243.1 MAG: hypothetical protein A2X39_09185 [Elusimicrobia bacterium GWC2_56_31]HBB65864.1 hypothetical protein [Elusimicrobiota bacterium]HBW21824.1 hypothetical protein [Elusimicrobiota bacterium]
MRNLRVALLLSCLLFPGTAAFAAQSEISAGMDKLADSLIGAYQIKHSSAADGKIAVFNFNSSKELEKKRIGFAVAELLTHRFVTKSGFTVVERLGLDKILEELKISMSGATDPDDALKAGKLGGAKLLVLGSVEKIGSKYHVNARLVEVETGEIAATAYESFPIGVFEEEAKSYIVYKPEIQRIGIYALANWRHNSNLSRQEFILNSYGQNVHTTVEPKTFNSLFWGVGLRYAPSAKLTIDVSAMNTGARPEAGHVKEEWTSPPSVISDDDYPVGVSAYRGLVSAKINLSRRFFAHIGAGFTAYRITTGSVLVYNNSPSGFAKVSYITPCVQLRTEYFLQDRVGISLSGNYDFTSKPARQTERDGLTKSNRVELDKFSLEPSISLYF